MIDLLEKLKTKLCLANVGKGRNSALLTSFSPRHKRDSEISRTQGNSSCHQVALGTLEKTQGIRKALSITWAPFGTKRERNDSSLVKPTEEARAVSSLGPYRLHSPFESFLYNHAVLPQACSAPSSFLTEQVPAKVQG